MPLLQLAGGNCCRGKVSRSVVGTCRKLRTVFDLVRAMEGYERNVELIGENKREYELRTGIIKVKDGAEEYIYPV